MSKSIIFIHGSPRKDGNTSIATGIAMKVAKDNGASISEIHAADIEYAIPGCMSCLKCHSSEAFGCTINDQLAKAILSLIDYDAIVLATPTYWMSYPAQLKMFIDRMGSLMKFSDTGEIRTPLAGKTFAILATGGGELEKNLHLLEQQWQGVAKMFSGQFHSCLLPELPVEPGVAVNGPQVFQKAQEFGLLLV